MPDPVDHVVQTRKLITWCQTQLRPFFARHKGPERAEELDAEVAQLDAALKVLDQDLSVCFLGSAGVGKSTLINALVAGDDIVVPAGGVGPLTAQALTVRYAEEPHFEVVYHPLQKLSQLAFGLKQMYEADLRALQAAEDVERLPLDAETATDIRTGLESEEHRNRKTQEFRKTAQLLVTGTQDGQAEIPYLLDRLYEAAGRPAAYGTTASPEDAERVRRIAAVLEIARDGQTGVFSHTDGEAAFREALKIHASGFLAPLIQELTLYWKSDLLRGGVELVDLPGIGIAGDVYREVAQTWIRERANAVVIVVDRSGITESAAELLRSTGYLNRLLYSADDPRGDPVIMVAVVQIDNVAEERYSQNETRFKDEHFIDVCAEFRPRLQAQMREQLEGVWKSDDGVGVEKQKVIGNILTTLQVHPLSAIQYRRALRQNRRDPAFIETPEQSNVPRLVTSIRELSSQRRDDRVRAMWDKALRLYRRAKAEVSLIKAEWEREDRAAAEAEKLREDVSAFLTPLREELRTRQGQYREFLKETVPQQIETLVGTAQNRARKAIVAYLRKLEDAHYAVLKAAVVKGGTHFGSRHIDLPRDFGLKFEEPIAEVWGREVLTKIRQRTKQFADDCVALVEQVVEWARGQGARVQPALLEAQRDSIKADAKNLAAIGKEKVEELGEQVKNSLIKEIETPIRRKCKAFVDRNAHIGAGVRRRILDLFDALAEEVTEAAAAPATAILTRLYKQVREEIDVVFGKWQDPLQAAADAIVATHESYVNRSDAQKRGKVLTAVAAVLDSRPAEPFDDEVGSDAEGGITLTSSSKHCESVAAGSSGADGVVGTTTASLNTTVGTTA